MMQFNSKIWMELASWICVGEKSIEEVISLTKMAILSVRKAMLFGKLTNLWMETSPKSLSSSNSISVGFKGYMNMRMAPREVENLKSRIQIYQLVVLKTLKATLSIHLVI